MIRRQNVNPVIAALQRDFGDSGDRVKIAFDLERQIYLRSIIRAPKGIKASWANLND